MDRTNPTGIDEYALANSGPPSALYDEIGEATKALAERLGVVGTPGRVGRLSGRLLTLLVRLAGVRNAVEIGTFTGTSTVCIAQGLPDDGYLVSYDVDPIWPRLARQAIEQAGLSSKVHIKIESALEGLKGASVDQYDFAFIDADKASYPKYLEALIPLIRRGGLIVADNTLWRGRVLDEDSTDAATMGIKRFNQLLLADGRLDALLLPIDDGISIAMRR